MFFYVLSCCNHSTCCC